MKRALAALAVPLIGLSGCGGEAPERQPVNEVEANVAPAVTPGARPAPIPERETAPIAEPAAPTQAQVEAEVSPALAACLKTGDAANGVSVAMGACFREEYRRQDAQLNAAYAKAMARLDGAGKARLRDEERAWISERDRSCEAARMGGTIDMVEVPSCLVEETIRRRMVLQAMAGA